MNSKELLGKTIEAVGAKQLKEDHENLKGMQDDLKDKENRFRNKENTLNQITNRLMTLEGNVKIFEEKEKIEKEMEVLRKREAWAELEETIHVIRHAKRKKDAVAKKIKESEEALQPILTDIGTQQTRRDQIEASVKTDTEASREVGLKAKNKGARFNTLNEEVYHLDDKLTEAQDQVDERENHIKKIEEEIQRMKAVYEEEASKDGADGGADAA